MVFRLELFAWVLSLRICCLACFVCDLFAWDLSFGIFPLGSFVLGFFVWNRSLGIFRLGSFAWDLSLVFSVSRTLPTQNTKVRLGMASDD